MDHYAGIGVSLELSSVCVVDAAGRIVREAKVASEPEALVAWELSEFPCLGPYDAAEGAIACPDANSLRSRRSCWTSS